MNKQEIILIYDFCIVLLNCKITVNCFLPELSMASPTASGGFFDLKSIVLASKQALFLCHNRPFGRTERAAENNIYIVIILLLCGFFESLFNIINDVFNILNAYRESYEVFINSAILQFLRGKLTVGCACRVQAAGAAVGNMGNY